MVNLVRMVSEHVKTVLSIVFNLQKKKKIKLK